MAKVFPWAAAKFVYNLLTSHTLRANLLICLLYTSDAADER